MKLMAIDKIICPADGGRDKNGVSMNYFCRVITFMQFQYKILKSVSSLEFRKQARNFTAKPALYTR